MASGLALAVYGLLLVPGAVLVWRRPVLALYAWVVGLAAHNAVMAALYGAGVRGGALTALQAWKEILLALALARVAFDVLRARRLPFRIHIADVLAFAFALIVCIYAVIPQDWLGGSADREAVGLALSPSTFRVNRTVATVMDECAHGTPAHAVGRLRERHPAEAPERLERDTIGAVRWLTLHGVLRQAAATGPPPEPVEAGADLP